MKKNTLIIAAIALCIPTLAQAEKGKCQKGHKGHPHRKAAMEKFDTDGDGKISEDERTALKAAMAERKAAAVAKYDTDGDGKISKDEHKAGHQAFKEEMLANYDANGDGKLDEDERKTAREAGVERPFFGHRKGKKCHGKRNGEKRGGKDGAE